jgi:RimJ/RimL family protein N-acetyltransferase
MILMRSYLKVIGPDITESELRLMMKWRKKNKLTYVEQQEITFKSFTWWFKEHYINQRRLLFWVVNDKGKPVGHMGFYEINGDSVKIDNLIRGEDGDKGIMSKALQELLIIGKRMFNNIYLKVKIENEYAINFYERNGFYIESIINHRGTPVYKMKYGK